MWLDVGKGDLHQALQGQKGQTGIDNQLQELTCFAFVEIDKIRRNNNEQINIKYIL